MMNELLAQYASEHPECDLKKIRRVVSIFTSKNIQQPTNTDFKNVLKVELRGQGKGGESTYYSYKKEAKAFYDWLAERQKGDMTNMTEEIVQEQENEQEQEITTEETMQQGQQRGRPKSNREQISLYMDKDIYATLKDMALMSRTNVSDIICKLAEAFVQRNIEAHKENMRNMKNYEY